MVIDLLLSELGDVWVGRSDYAIMSLCNEYCAVW